MKGGVYEVSTQGPPCYDYCIDYIDARGISKLFALNMAIDTLKLKSQKDIEAKK